MLHTSLEARFDTVESIKVDSERVNNLQAAASAADFQNPMICHLMF